MSRYIAGRGNWYTPGLFPSSRGRSVDLGSRGNADRRGDLPVAVDSRPLLLRGPRSRGEAERALARRPRRLENSRTTPLSPSLCRPPFSGSFFPALADRVPPRARGNASVFSSSVYRLLHVRRHVGGEGERRSPRAVAEDGIEKTEMRKMRIYDERR